MAGIATWTFEPNGSPNLVNWPSGTVPVTIYAKVENPTAGHTYNIVPRLMRGQYSYGSWTPYDTGTDSAPPSSLSPQTITTSWALYTFAVPVQALSGLTSDRLFLWVLGQRDDAEGDPSAIIHLGSDGGSNQTMVSPAFYSSPAIPTSLQRNPDSTRPAEVLSATVTGGGSISLGTYQSAAGDPGLAIWSARVWRLRIWARATSGTATLTAGVTRQPSGATLAPSVAIGTVSSSTWTLFRVDFAVPATSGTIGDMISVGLVMASTGTATVEVGVGLTHPSNLNAPLLAPPGGSAVVPTDDHKVMVESGSTPGYLSEVVQSADGSVVFSVDPGTLRLDTKVIPGVSAPVIDVNTGAGWLVFTRHSVAWANTCDFTSTDGTLQGISKKWNDGRPIPDHFEVMVFIVNATPSNLITVVNGATPPGGSDFLPLALDTNGGDEMSDKFAGPTAMWFWLDLTNQRWCQARASHTYSIP